MTRQPQRLEGVREKKRERREEAVSGELTAETGSELQLENMHDACWNRKQAGREAEFNKVRTKFEPVREGFLVTSRWCRQAQRKQREKRRVIDDSAVCLLTAVVNGSDQSARTEFHCSFQAKYLFPSSSTLFCLVLLVPQAGFLSKCESFTLISIILPS